MRKIDVLTQTWREQNLLLPIWMDGEAVYVLNQRELPFKESILCIRDVAQLAQAIRDMAIRGSGAIATAGAIGMLLAALNSNGDKRTVLDAGEQLKRTRQTAINLMKTVDELTKAVSGYAGKDPTGFLEDKVCDVLVRQLDFEKRLGAYGAGVIEDGDAILTHCNSGALAGSGYGGRALSVIRSAFEQGKDIHVFVSETRPYLQGARLTVYELERFGIPHTMITDGTSGYLMRLGRIHKVVVGSDRVAANGDLFNKVGTYMHALAASANGVPFYTATSLHTIDFTLPRAASFDVEYRAKEEVTHLNGHPITLPDTDALYPSFDATPHELISGIITECGVIRPPYDENLRVLEK